MKCTSNRNYFSCTDTLACERMNGKKRLESAFPQYLQSIFTHI